MKATDATAPDLDALVAEVADRFTSEVAAGHSPDIEAYATQHPEIAAVIRQVFPALAVLGNLPRTAVADSTNATLAPNIEHPHADSSAISQLGGAVGRGSSEPAHPESTSGILGDFRILREIGRGGMGVVYEAEQISLGRRVALKVLPFAAMLDRQQLARFKNEARAAATLDHPNIVAIHSVGCERGVHYYAMQLIEGQSLAQVVEQLKGSRERRAASSEESHDESSPLTTRHSPLADTAPIAALSTLKTTQPQEFFRTVAQLGIQAAEALDHAHQNGILHRDIKPANLLVEGSGIGHNSGPKLWITDFGLARLESDAGMTMTGDILGTLRYMSPEQALANRVVVDHRSDIYSLGITLYELLTLQPAFTGDDRQALLRQIAFEDPRRPRQINARIPQDLETIALKAIEKIPADRYATAHELAEDLVRFLHMQPISARPITQGQRLARWMRRNTLVAGLLATIAVLSLAVAIVASLGYFRTSGALKRAEEEAAVAAAVNQFLQEDLLELADSESQFEAGFKPDPALKLSTVLDRALTKVDARFAHQPRIRAALQNTLASSLHGVGRYDDAIRLWEQVREYQEETLGQAHPDTLKTIDRIARANKDCGRLRRAIELYEEVLRIRHENQLDTQGSVTGLAEVYRLAGEVDKSIALQQQSLEYTRKQCGPIHPDTIDKMNCLAAAYSSAGRFDEAVALHEQALELARTVHGPAHPFTNTVMGFLVSMDYPGAKQHDKAIKLAEQTLQLMRKERGPEHEDILVWANFLTVSYFNAERFQEAVANGERTLFLSIRVLGPDHPGTQAIKNNLAVAYRSTKQMEKARKLSEELLEYHRHKSPGNPNEMAWALSELAAALLQQENWSRSEQLLREALEGLSDTANDDELKLITTARLGASFGGQQKFAEGEPLLVQSYAQLKRMAKQVHPRHIRESCEHLVAFYERWGKPVEAAIYRSESPTTEKKSEAAIAPTAIEKPEPNK